MFTMSPKTGAWAGERGTLLALSTWNNQYLHREYVRCRASRLTRLRTGGVNWVKIARCERNGIVNEIMATSALEGRKQLTKPNKKTG